MRFARVQKIASYLLATLGLVALCADGDLVGASMIVLALGVVASWFTEGEILQSSRYIRLWNIAIIIGLLIETTRAMFFHLPALTAAVEFAALLQLSRLANRRTAREYQQITVLALLHLIAATVLGGGLSYAVCFVGFVIVTPWAMTLGHLRREIEGNYLADARAGRAGVPIDVARILRSRRVVGSGLLIGSSLLAIPIFALTAVLFVVFPRIGLGVFSVHPPRSNPVAGLGDQVDLSGHGTIRDDPTIVLRLEPPSGELHPPTHHAFRLRGAAYDYYDGHAWMRSASQRSPVARESSYYALRRWPNKRTDLAYRIVSDALDPPVVLLPPGTVSIQVEPRIEAGLPRYPEITRDARGEVRYGDTDDLGLVYTAYTPPEDPERGDGATLSPAARARYLALPAMSPRFEALAHRLTDNELNPLAKSVAIQRYLHGFRYTLSLESGHAEHPLEDFLFRTHAGHCEYFSTAMAVLLRTVGVPTRNITGFLGGVYNRYGGFYAIRQGDAHSWVEVYDSRQGWTTFDPTPPAREVPSGRDSALGELDAVIEALRTRWRRYILGFDLGTQARLVTRAVQLLERRPRRGVQPDSVHDSWKRMTEALRDQWRHSRTLILALGAAVTTAAILARSVPRWRRRRTDATAERSLARHAHVRDAVALAQALDTALSARGYPRPRGRSPVGFARDLASSGSPMAPLAHTVAERYMSARFGGDPLRPGELESLRQQLRQQLRKEINPLG